MFESLEGQKLVFVLRLYVTLDFVSLKYLKNYGATGEFILKTTCKSKVVRETKFVFFFFDNM